MNFLNPYLIVFVLVIGYLFIRTKKDRSLTRTERSGVMMNIFVGTFIYLVFRAIGFWVANREAGWERARCPPEGCPT